MLLTIAFILIVLWIVGLVIFPVLGWVVHLLLVVAVIMILLRLIRGK
jgi:hypothetical protein